MGVPDLFDLTGKVAVVTGAGSGLGKAFAEGLAAMGAKVACADIDLNTASESAKTIEETFKVEALPLKMDVTQENEVAEKMGEVEDRLNGLDILVNNAGISGRGYAIHEMPIEEWNRVVNVNLHGVFLCTREAAKHMLTRKKGKIINIASVWGIVGTSSIAPLPHYAATKGALINFTREAALEYATHGINVNCIAPGFFGGTNISAGWDPVFLEKFLESAPRIIPTQQFGVASDLKGTVVYLASSASDAVTGHTLVIDNGVTAW
ncbi:MAG: SDR family oxidoreductase [Thermodesulfobacteriota bacterium]|nr:SDR family oxidoreductase [Thermodesulfobacteriota bacterium]